MDEFHLGKPGKLLPGLQALPKIFFGMFYHQFAGQYDLVTRVISMGLWKTWLSTTLSYLSGPAILELGFGPGHLQKILGHNGFKVFGLEESPQMIALAWKRLETTAFTPTHVQAVGEAIPFRDSTFDQVVATFPAEFITHQRTLGDIHRVLKDDGELIILRFAWLSTHQWPYKMTAWLFRLVGEAPRARQPLPVDKLSTPFQKAGFAVHIDQIDLSSSGMIVMRCKKTRQQSGDTTAPINMVKSTGLGILT
jgi:ubiquinone/menaquinone biosynthesis C-methylase UbiE